MWIEKDLDILKTNHGKLTLVQINKLLSEPKTYTCIRSQAQRLGLYRHKKTGISLPTKNTFDMNYWDNPTLISSYLGGLIAGDGCLREKKNGSIAFSYKCSIKDESIIDLFIKELNYIGPKTYTWAPSPRYPDRISKFVALQIPAGFDNNAQNLKKYFNLGPQKTHRLGPTNLLNKNLNYAYIIGLIDSDGSIESGLRQKKYKKLDFSLNSCSSLILEWTKQMFDKDFPADRISKIRKSKRDNVYQYYIGGLRAARILDFLLKFNVPKLKRKWENPEFIDNLNYFKQKYPQYFSQNPIDFSINSSVIDNKDVENIKFDNLN